MPFSADAIANYFLDCATASQQSLTHMHVQKLVYFSHGWHLALADLPLINENIEAWKYGPVVRSLFGEFREFGKEPITRKARELEMGREHGKVTIRFWEPTVDDEQPGADFNKDLTKAILAKTWEIYGKLTPIHLSNLTHQRGEPWQIVLETVKGEMPKGLHIPNQLIQDVFKAKLPSQAHGQKQAAV